MAPERKMLLLLLPNERRFQTTVKESGIDLTLHRVKHTIDKVDQRITISHGLLDMTVSDCVQNGEMAINRSKETCAAFYVPEMKPTNSAEYCVQRPHGVFEKWLSCRGQYKAV